MNVPVTKNGPKGTSDFKFFFFAKINPIPIIAPIKNAKKSETKILGKPRKRPIKTANFTSPKHSHLPLETRKIIRKNNDAPRLE